MKKKSQVQIGESVAVIIFFIILVIIGIAFYLKESQQNQQKEISSHSMNQAASISKRIMNLKELSCRLKNGVISLGCIDLEKYKVVAGVIQNNEIAKNYYMSMFGASTISLDIVYSYDSSLVGNYTLYNITSGKQSCTNLEIPAMIYDSISKKSMLGFLSICYYGELQ